MSSVTFTGSPRAHFSCHVASSRSLGRGDHAIELPEDAAVEGGLHHAPLPLPELALAHYDAVAEQDLDAIEATPLA